MRASRAASIFKYTKLTHKPLMQKSQILIYIRQLAVVVIIIVVSPASSHAQAQLHLVSGLYLTPRPPPRSAGHGP